MQQPIWIGAPRQETSVLKWELDPILSRSTVTLMSTSADQVFEIGTVLGCRTLGIPTSAAKTGGNTGAGTLGALALQGAAKVGAYSLTCIAAAVGGGVFAVFSPAGHRLADAVVGTPYADPEIGFTLAHVGADFIVGDGFVITVPAGDGRSLPLNLAVLDGSHIAAAVLLNRVVVPATVDTNAVGLMGFGAVDGSTLIWPTGFTAPQIAAATAQLAALSIKTLLEV